MDQTLLKYWKTCLQDAERKAIAPKGARITLNIGDKILKFVPLKSIPVIFPDWKAEDSNEKQKVMIAPCILLPEFENGWTSQSERPEYPFLITATMLPDGKLTVCENESDRIPIFIRKFLEPVWCWENHSEHFQKLHSLPCSRPFYNTVWRFRRL